MSDSQKEAEAFFKTRLPGDSSDINYYYFKPGSEHGVYSVYLKFKCSQESYAHFYQQLGLKTYQQQPSPHLPAAWQLPSALTLNWWDATHSTPDNAAAKSIENGGWIVAKYEQGSVYLVTEGQMHG